MQSGLTRDTVIAGHIVSVGADGTLVDIPVIGYVVVGTTLYRP